VVRLNEGRRQQISYAFSQFRIAGRGILNFEKLARKTAEVMNGPRLLHSGDRRAGQIPMG
jgi:hypothetical protein